MGKKYIIYTSPLFLIICYRHVQSFTNWDWERSNRLDLFIYLFIVILMGKGARRLAGETRKCPLIGGWLKYKQGCHALVSKSFVGDLFPCVTFMVSGYL
jgi:hypothetical protein